MTLVGNFLCIDKDQSAAQVKMLAAIEACRDQGQRVCTMQDLLYACKKGEDYIDDGMWMGNTINDDGWAIANKNDCNSGGDYNIEGTSGHPDNRHYRCCY